jgi:hypothetical protein
VVVCLLIEFLFFFVFVNAGLREQIANPGLRFVAAVGITLAIVFVIAPLMDGNWGPSIYGTGTP